MSRVRIRIPGTNDVFNQKKFLGSKIFYITDRESTKKIKTEWGKIVSLHGRTGVFLAKFKKQISPSKMASHVYIVSKTSLE